jgi:hypothetical protein
LSHGGTYVKPHHVRQHDSMEERNQKKILWNLGR